MLRHVDTVLRGLTNAYLVLHLNVLSDRQIVHQLLLCVVITYKYLLRGPIVLIQCEAGLVSLTVGVLEERNSANCCQELTY